MSPERWNVPEIGSTPSSVMIPVQSSSAGGSLSLAVRPAGGAGIELAYKLAEDSFLKGGINRVVLASDGVANVGLTDPDGLVRMIRDDADAGLTELLEAMAEALT